MSVECLCSFYHLREWFILHHRIRQFSLSPCNLLWSVEFVLKIRDKSAKVHIASKCALFHRHGLDVGRCDHDFTLLVAKVFLNVIPILHMRIRGFDWNSEATLRFERLLITIFYLDVSVFAPGDFHDCWLELFTQGVVARRYEEHLVETLTAFDWISTDVGRVSQYLLRVFAIWIASWFFLLPHAIIADSQRGV